MFSTLHCFSFKEGRKTCLSKVFILPLKDTQQRAFWVLFYLWQKKKATFPFKSTSLIVFSAEQGLTQITGCASLERTQILLKSVTSEFIILLTSDVKAKKERWHFDAISASSCSMGRACQRGRLLFPKLKSMSRVGLKCIRMRIVNQETAFVIE